MADLDVMVSVLRELVLMGANAVFILRSLLMFRRAIDADVL